MSMEIARHRIPMTGASAGIPVCSPLAGAAGMSENCVCEMTVRGVDYTMR